MGSYLSSVSATPKRLPPRITLHGKGGSGKSTFAASLHKPIFLPAEEGLGTLQVPAFPRPESFVDVMNTIGELAGEEHDYRSFVVDTIDHVEPLIWDHVCVERSGKTQFQNIEDFGYGKGYTFADPCWIQFFTALDELRRKGMTVCILSHNEVKTISDPVLSPYDTVQPKLHKRANALLYEWSDVVGYLAVKRASVEKEGARGRKVTTTTLMGGERILHLEDTGGFEAKNRYSLPPSIEVPLDNPAGPLREALLKSMNLHETKENP